MAGNSHSSPRAKKKFGALLVAIVTFGSLVLAAAPASADTLFFGASSFMNPDSVTVGGEANDTITIFNENEQTAHDVFLEVFLNQGTFDLKLTKGLNPGVSCKLQHIVESTQLDPRHLGCQVGDIDSGSKDVQIIISTADVVTNESTTVEADVDVTSSDPGFCDSEACQSGFLTVFAGSDTATQTFVPPGGTASVGPKKPDAENPAVGSVKLPKKIAGPEALFANASGKTVPGPGAALTMTVEDSSFDGPTACGGQPCRSHIVTLSPFVGYNDPKHPVLFTVSYFANEVSPPLGSGVEAGIVYHIKNGVGVALDKTLNKCKKSHGSYINLPCLTKYKFKSGVISATIAEGDSSDPHGGVR